MQRVRLSKEEIKVIKETAEEIFGKGTMVTSLGVEFILKEKEEILIFILNLYLKTIF